MIPFTSLSMERTSWKQVSCRYELTDSNPHLDTLMHDVYEKKKDADGFLYITYTDETTLG